MRPGVRLGQDAHCDVLILGSGAAALSCALRAAVGWYQAAWRRPLIRASVQRTANLLRWAVRNSAAQRARRRLLPDS